MVWGVIQTFRQALKYRGGWRGLIEHMYTNGDYPFKVGTYMGCDAAGNRYYENRVDYPFGQHRWVEPGDIHNFDSSSIPPEWHGWMTSMNDATPSQEESFINERKSHIDTTSNGSNAHFDDNIIGHQENIFNFHHLHNQTQVRSRGYGIGNPIVGLPPHAKDSYYTQPGSPYNENHRRPLVMQGDLDEATGGGRPYKSFKWADRLRTEKEKEELEMKRDLETRRILDAAKEASDNRITLLRGRGAGTVL